jgi:predicted nuclease of predicted toxin-antitoxin system
MKIWVDAQLPPAIAPWIARQFNVECIHIRETSLAGAGDDSIFRTLRHHESDGPVILTKDEDFADLVARLSPPPQVLWLRIGNLTNRSLREYLPKVMSRAIEALLAGEPLVELRHAP